MHDIEERIRAAFPFDSDIALDDATWAKVREDAARVERRATARRRPWRVAVVAMVVVVVMSGVALAAEPELLDRLFPKGSGGDRMEVMREPRPVGDGKASDLPPDVKRLAEMMAQADDPVRLDGYRILLDHRDGDVHSTLYAFPTESGEVCHFWHGTFGSGGCGGLTFQPGSATASTSGHFGLEDGWDTITSIKGLTTDDVKSVKVRLEDGTIDDAIMGRNSFLWYPRPYDDLARYVFTKEPEKLPPPKRSEPDELIVELKDGTISEGGLTS